MSSREPLRRSPRKRPPKRREDQSSQRPQRNDLRSRLRRNDRPERRPKEDRKERKVINKVIKKTFLDVKLDIYSQKNNPGAKEKTDILSDEFDPMSFIYSDVEPPHIESQARAADCVQMLLAKWDREDGLVTGTL